MGLCEGVGLGVVSCFATQQLPASQLRRLFGERGCRHLQTVREVRRPLLLLSPPPPPLPHLWLSLRSRPLPDRLALLPGAPVCV
jgi:hypothetical protein